MEEKELLQEICSECNGCTLPPQHINDLCSNPLEKYLFRKGSFQPIETNIESYFKGRRDGIIIGSYQTAPSN